jgi:predicted nucleic acid-binding protein
VTLIIDASVALKWFLIGEPDADRALAIVREGARLIAPDVVVVEVSNAAWKSARLGRIGATQVAAIACGLPRFFDVLVGAAELAPRAVAIADELDHPVYDALYLALAERESTQLITADGRLWAKLQGTSWANLVTNLANHAAKA